MPALREILVGVLVAHAAWAYFFLCGSIVTVGRTPISRISRGLAGVQIVLTTATGMAITGLATFVVGIFHEIYPVTALVWLLLLSVAFALLGDSPLNAKFWRSRATLWRSAWGWPFACIYLIALIMSIPAYLPDTGSDATSYHIPYAWDWAKAHYVYADAWLRLPYYANNWLLLDTWLIELGLLPFIPFLTWLTGLLSLLGVAAGIEAFAADYGHAWRSGSVAVAAAISVAANATFFNVLDGGFVDVQLGFFFLCCLLAVALATRNEDTSAVAHAVFCGAFLVGSKVSLIALLPVLLLAIVFALRISKAPVRAIMLACLALTLLSSPWYVRNFIEAGDPIAPTLNLALHGVDSKWSREDMKDQLGDLHTDKSPLGLLRLPIAIFSDPESHEYREHGVTLLVAFLFAPGIFLAWAILARRIDRYPELVIFAGLTLYAIAYWNITSHLARYSLLFYPALALFSALLLLRYFRNARAWVPLAVMLAAAIPSPAAANWYGAVWRNDYINEWTWYKDDTSWLEPRCAAYPQLEYLDNVLTPNAKKNSRVYGVQTNYMDLYFRERGITLIGDAFGPERAVDFAYAIRTNTVAKHASYLHIGAYIVPNEATLTPATRGLSYTDLATLDREMSARGYKKAEFPNGRYVVYVNPNLIKK